MACACGKGTCNCSAPTTINLMDENGGVHPFYVADKLLIDTKEYAFAVSLEDSDQYALLNVEKDADGNETYQNIVDESEWAKIRAFLTAQ